MKQTPKKQKPKKAVSDKPKKTRVKTPAMIANPGGRPSDFDKAAPKIIASIRAGNTYECASACARVTYQTFCNWMRQGKEDIELGLTDSKFFRFFYDVEEAEMLMEQDCVRAWQNFVPQNWQAARDFLSRRNPDKWSAKDKVDVTSNGESVGQPVFLPMKKADD